jgi:cell division protein FtsL
MSWLDVYLPVTTLALLVLYRFSQMQREINDLKKKIGEQHERR